MKYTVAGFNQAHLVTLGLNLIDAEILRWFVDFQGTGRMREFAREDGVRFFLVSYKAVIADLPCIEVTSVSAMTRRFQKLAEVGALEHYHATIGGSFSCYRLGPEYMALLADTPSSVSAGGSAPAPNPQASKVEPSSVNAGPPPASTLEQKTLLPTTHLPTPKETALDLPTALPPTSPPRFTHTSADIDGYFATWNDAGLPEYRKLLANVPNAGELVQALSFYSPDEVRAAIGAYATVQRGDGYEMGFRYQTVVSFLVKGLESFAPGARPLEVFRVAGGGKVEAVRSDPLRGVFRDLGRVAG